MHDEQKNILSYFSPRDPTGRKYLATTAVTLAVSAVPGMLFVVPGFVLALVALGFGIAATRYIDPAEEPLAHSRAQAAIILSFMVLMISCGLTGSLLQ